MPDPQISSAGTEPRESGRLPALDAVRGVAILLVVIFHYLLPQTGNVYLATIIGPFGLGGVALFFMLSGFLIERHLSRDRDLIRYFTRRIFRILPAYWVALALILLIDFVATGRTVWTARDIAANVFLVQDIVSAPPLIGVLWTLLIEIKFYLVAPFVMRAGRLALQLAPWLTLAGDVAVFMVRGEASMLLTYMTFCFIGMQFGLWHRREMSGFSLAILVAVVALATGAMLHIYGIGLAVFVVFNSALLTFALRRSFTAPGLPFVGRVSYSWYLLHAGIGYPLLTGLGMVFGSTTGPAGLAAAGIAIVATLAASWLSFVLVETPGIGLGKKVERLLRAGASGCRAV